ncbi:Tripeptidyl-peptidase sed3 [Hypsibius exemplaris]|uniref:tripeptidyl-peptidase II n=1 Tax=Hypsibius exemplaris TaxID=2072580 RepID=A0A1W0XFD5_HYPEX|nr:Tripeptidyl-peptidase sed3 [Hypsibius exemplaris]
MHTLFVRPTLNYAAIDKVLWWLVVENSISPSDMIHDSDWIHFNVTVDQAEILLHTKFHRYRNTLNGEERIRTLGYSIPRGLLFHIDMIQPTTRFGRTRVEKRGPFEWEPVRKADGKPKVAVSQTLSGVFDFASCNATLFPKSVTVTPDCIRHLYNLGYYNLYSAVLNKRSRFGVAGFLDQWAQFGALETFLKEFAPYATDNLEADLDVQYAVSLGYPVPVEYYSTGGLGESIPDVANGGTNTNEPYLDFLHYMLALPDDQLPQTLSISYGDDEWSVPAIFARSTCNLFAQLGARGVSVCAATSDDGPGAGCQTNDGTNRTRFVTSFPASCPFVTAVGGTFGVVPEQAVFFSGGGFSDLFPQPDYQQIAVAAYLDGLASKQAGLFDPYGRATPDVSAQALFLYIVSNGSDSRASGTSVATPIFSSIIALLNNDRLNRGLSVLGFLNPWLYSLGQDAGLTDIIVGGSNGCFANGSFTGLSAPYVPFAGWNATVGWDPVTGLGTPNYPALLRSSTTAAHSY